MKYKILFWVTLLCVFGGMIFFHQFETTNDLFQKYQRFGFLKSDLRYEKAEKTWGKNGLIFYRVQFPKFNFPILADKMRLSLDENKVVISLENAHINISDILDKLYGNQIEKELDQYVPYRDFEKKMITSMALMGLDELTSNVLIQGTYSDINHMQIKGEIKQNNQLLISFTGNVQAPIPGAKQMSDLWLGKIKEAHLQIQDSLFQRYVLYAKSRGFEPSEDFKKGIIPIKPQNELRLKDVLN